MTSSLRCSTTAVTLTGSGLVRCQVVDGLIERDAGLVAKRAIRLFHQLRADDVAANEMVRVRRLERGR